MGQDQLFGASWRAGPNLLSNLLYWQGSPPDAESFQVSARRRLSGVVALVAVPASGSNTGTVTLAIPDNVGQGDGLFFELLSAQVIPADTTGHLTIVDTGLTVGIGGNPIVAVATPQPTTLIPRVSTTLLFGAVPLLSGTDLNQWSIQQAAGSIFSNVASLQLALTVSMVNNDAGAGHNFTVRFWAAYRFVNGLQGA